MDYLLTHFTIKDNYQQLLKAEDSLQLRRQFLVDLKNDSLFTQVMSELVGKAVDKQLAKDTVAMDDLLSVAVKFFNIRKINEKGHYSVKVCTGRNEIKSTEKERKPFVEAFAFTSIMEHYRGEYDLYGEFVQVVKKIYKVNLGIDEDERLLRAQGAMFLLMRENEALRKMLISEYEANKKDLPFILVRNSWGFRVELIWIWWYGWTILQSIYSWFRVALPKRIHHPPVLCPSSIQWIRDVEVGQSFLLDGEHDWR